MKIKELLTVCGLLALPFNVVGQSNTATAECKIVNCLNAAQLQEKPAVCNVANGVPINFYIWVRDGSPAMKSPKADMVNPNPVPAEGVYYLVKVIRQKDGAEVPVRCSDIGGSSGSGTFRVFISMEIPESDAIRHAKTEAFWKKSKARMTKEELEVQSQHGIPEEKLIAALQEELQENELGMFKITCTYVSTVPGTWKGEIQAPPVTINVANTGSNFDRLEKKEEAK